jgi:hypothetical protein
MMASFDNRTLLNKLGLDVVQKAFDWRSSKGELHLYGRVGDLTLGYCYIRKNACSSFKQLFLDVGPEEYLSTDWKRKIDFLISHRMLRSSQVDDCDKMVFVYRDPYERVVSLYKNKFIQMDGHEDLFKSYRAVTTKDPEEATFHEFVHDYLRPNFRELDLHVLPQSWHLKRFNYTHAVRMDMLYHEMVGVVGSSVADQYFKKPVNDTKQNTEVFIEGCSNFPASDLVTRFETDGTMPSVECLLDESCKRRLQTLYKADFEMIDKVEASSR